MRLRRARRRPDRRPFLLRPVAPATTRAAIGMRAIAEGLNPSAAARSSWAAWRRHARRDLRRRVGAPADLCERHPARTAYYGPLVIARDGAPATSFVLIMMPPIRHAGRVADHGSTASPRCCSGRHAGFRRRWRAHAVGVADQVSVVMRSTTQLDARRARGRERDQHDVHQRAEPARRRGVGLSRAHQRRSPSSAGARSPLNAATVAYLPPVRRYRFDRA